MKKRIMLCAIATCLGIALTACGNTGEKDADTEVTENATEVISYGAIGEAPKITSDNIKIEDYKPQKIKKFEEKYVKKLEEGKYSVSKPYVVVNPYGDAPLSAYIMFSLKGEYKVKITVPGKTENADVKGEISGKDYFRVPVVGLYPGKTNKVKLEITDSKKKKVKSTVVDVKTEALPKCLDNAIRLEKGGKSSAYNLTIVSGQNTKYPFAYDCNGDIRWFVSETTGSYGIFPLSNNRLIYQTDASLTPTEEKAQATEMWEMDYMGRIYQIYFVKNGIHHEVIEKTKGGNLLVLSSSIDGHIEDVVLEIDRETGKTVKELDMRKIFDSTYVDKTDWAHLNTVSYNEKDNSILLSPRNVHAAVKVDWKTDEIKWIIANPQMFKGTKQESKVLKPQGNIIWHFQQHSVYEIPYDLDGDKDTIHIMLYDNHWQTKRKVDFFDGREQSYVMVYTVNESTGVVRQDKVFPGVRSIITSNCMYDKKSRHMFSFGGYLYPLIDNRKGMIYEFDYKTGAVINQYSTSKYFYRGYEMVIDWDDLSRTAKIGDNILKGTLQAPTKVESIKKADGKLSDANVSFKIIGEILYMHTSDHAISKVRFQGDKYNYVVDYSKAGKGMKSKANQTYNIAIPLSGLKSDKYQIVVKYGSEWLDAKAGFSK
ncbi:aryl-sulfate sulfotransferase [Eubacterium xylanophilum]|uniref:aryl-sulfate sulfotransferase n=1 Tax=Eubacterium xylanophilum TaxID=39497 RepID=UPI00047A6E42|nr:aryl-sulfate sulfotransferase [Eubacterium xylanophilum]